MVMVLSIVIWEGLCSPLVLSGATVTENNDASIKVVDIVRTVTVAVASKRFD